MTPHRSCAATSKRTGRQCGSTPALGYTVCRWHGASAPQVKRTARERLDALVDPAIAELERILHGSDTSLLKLRAVIEILDRSWGKAQQHLDVSTNTSGLYEQGGTVKSYGPEVRTSDV